MCDILFLIYKFQKLHVHKPISNSFIKIWKKIINILKYQVITIKTHIGIKNFISLLAK